MTREKVICEACAKPIERGQFVHCYEDVGEVHDDCDHPNAFSADPGAVVLVGEPLRRTRLLASARMGVSQITDAMIDAGLDGAEAYCTLHMPASPKWRDQDPGTQLKMRSYIAAVLAGALGREDQSNGTS